MHQTDTIGAPATGGRQRRRRIRLLAALAAIVLIVAGYERRPGPRGRRRP